MSEKIPITKMPEKYDRVLKYCEKEVERIIKMFKKERDDPPVPWHFPPIAGKLYLIHYVYKNVIFIITRLNIL